ncbi:hypothetical protein [Lysobacter xanthus]
MIRRLLPLLLLAALPAFAQDVASSAPAAIRTVAAPADRMSDRTCLRETGSRIRPRDSARGGPRARCLAGNGRVYTQDDLRGTGQTDLNEALRMLDPSIR